MFTECTVGVGVYILYSGSRVFTGCTEGLKNIRDVQGEQGLCCVYTWGRMYTGCTVGLGRMQDVQWD